MSLVNILRKSEKLVFWNRCRIHRNDPEFRKMVLEGYHNPDFLKMHTFGNEYKGKTVYLVDEQGSGVGFFAELGVTLIKLYFADERNFTPYLHWGKDYLYYEPDGVNEEKNAFLYFFEPVSEIHSIEYANHVICSEYCHYEQVKSIFNAVSYDVSEEYIDAMAKMVKKYIRYNSSTKRYLEEESGRILEEEKILGIHYRGTDFRKQYNNHPIPVNIEQEIEIASELIRKSGYSRIFLATDEQEAVEKFRKAFGDKVYIYEDTFRDEGTDESIAFSESKRDKHHYLLAKRGIKRSIYTVTM